MLDYYYYCDYNHKIGKIMHFGISLISGTRHSPSPHSGLPQHYLRSDPPPLFLATPLAATSPVAPRPAATTPAATTLVATTLLRTTLAATLLMNPVVISKLNFIAKPFIQFSWYFAFTMPKAESRL